MTNRGVSVIGLGYIGLPTSAAIAAHGARVFGVDVDPERVAEINAGRTPIVEPDLDAAVASAVERGLLTASTTPGPADFHIIAVPTPFTEGRTPDLTYVESATRAIAAVIEAGDVVVLESTSPPGATLKVSEWLAAARPDLKFPHEHPDSPDVHVAHCPERVLPGRIMIEIRENDRVIGGLTPTCAERAAELYRLFSRGEIALTDAASAEMAKLVENSFRDVNIAFANELANICDELGFDVWEIIRLANKHPRVNVLNPGPGVGGHCIAVDPWFIVAAAPKESRIIRLARETNDARPAAVVEKVLAVAEGSAPIACLGLAFKANVDDLRESPAVEVLELLSDAAPDRQILAVEPHVTSLPRGLADRDNVSLVSLEDAIARAGAIVLLVDHDAFKAAAPALRPEQAVIDTRGFWRA